MSTSPGFAAGAWTSVMPNAAALRRGDVASARFGPDSGNDMRQATARSGRCAVLGRMPLGSGRLRLSPTAPKIISRNGKVNRLPQRSKSKIDEFAIGARGTALKKRAKKIQCAEFTRLICESLLLRTDKERHHAGMIVLDSCFARGGPAVEFGDEPGGHILRVAIRSIVRLVDACRQ